MQVLNTWSKDHMQQQDLFNPMELSPSHRAILMHYAGAKALSVEQGELYAAEAMRMGMRQEDLKAREPVGKSRTAHSVRTRQIRWWQQDLKARGWIERVPQSRGRWRLTEPARKALTEQAPGRVMLGVSTELGIALWASAEDVYSRLDEYKMVGDDATGEEGYYRPTDREKALIKGAIMGLFGGLTNTEAEAPDENTQPGRA